MRAMADDDRTALLITRQHEHLVRRRSYVEWRRDARMNSRRGHTGPLERRAGGAQDWFGLRISDRHPPALCRAQFGFDLFFALRNLRASGFQQLRRQARGDIREMDGDPIAPRQKASEVADNS